MLEADEGYFFGIGAFETIAVEKGTPIFLEAHYRRLCRAMEFLKLEISIEQVKEKAEEVLAEPRLQEGRKVLKITVSPKNLLVSVRENTYTEKDYERGFAAAYSKVRRNETSPFTYHKTLNYGDCLFEKRRAKAEGIDEPIFLNTRGEICEGATTNVFFVKGGELFTPPVSSGLLGGILREYLCERYQVKECVIRPEDVTGFEEMFLTNSLLGVMPVSRLESFVFPSRERAKELLGEIPRFRT